ncbi:MAG: peptidylprolyl isomerase [Calditrichaeota bacterium]|nr:MAG: peptidylprolyl isomerase [Calditrichota bacterium]
MAAKSGDKVKVHYKGMLDDGTVFDSSFDSEPLEFVIGENMVIPGFENAVKGMNVGDTKKFSVPPEEAYGPYREDLVVEIDRSHVPPHIDLELGMMLQVRSQEGSVTNVKVTEIGEETVTLDANHPLAGKALTFEIELVDVS